MNLTPEDWALERDYEDKLERATEVNPAQGVGEWKWEPVDCVQLVSGREVCCDETGLYIGHGDSLHNALAWPEKGRYALCERRQIRKTDADILHDALAIALGMATGKYVQSDAEMRKRIGEVLSKAMAACAAPSPASAVPVEPLIVDEPDEWGNVRIWPFEREAHLVSFTVIPRFYERDGSVSGARINHSNYPASIEDTRRYAIALLRACEIAEQMQAEQRPADD